MTPPSGESRLLVVTNDYPPKPGGIQMYLANLLAAHPGPVRVLAPTDRPALESPLGEGVVRRHHRAFLWPTPQVARWVERQATEFGPDAILFGAPYPLPALGPRLRRALGVPVGVLCHGAEITVPAAIPGVRQVLARMLRRADVRFTVSRFTARRVERLTGAAATYVGAGYARDQFWPAEGHDEAMLVVGCVSRFVPRKGQQRLLAATARLASQGVPIRVLLVGKGRHESKLRRLARRLGVDVRFEVDVPWERLGGLYREMDAFCMPCKSRWAGLEVEGLGLVFLEAAASGLPVLAGDSGGAPETVIPGETGFIVHSVADIVEGILLFASDTERARKMGRSGRDWVDAEYSWRRAAERVVAGFEAVASP